MLTLLRLLLNNRRLGLVKTKRVGINSLVMPFAKFFSGLCFLKFRPQREGEVHKEGHLRCNSMYPPFFLSHFIAQISFAWFLDVVKTFTTNTWPLTKLRFPRISN